MTTNVFFGEDAVFDITQKSVSTDFLTKTKEFDDIKATSLLEDKRSTRTKSTGRPPSQMFMKESIFQTSFSMNDDEPVTEPMVNSNKFSQIVQEVTARHMSRTIVDGSVSSVIKGSQSSLAEIQTSKIHRVPWMNELLARKEKVAAKGDEFMKIGEQNESRYSFKFHRNEVNPETTKPHSFDDLNTVEQSQPKEENVTITSEDDIKKPLKKMIAPPFPVDLAPKVDKKQPELVPKASIKSVLKDLDSFVKRRKQFEENILMKIRELENSIRKQKEEEANGIEILKRDLTRLIESS